ncbi:amidohydrolase family protein [Actinocatenispora rupis]|uniref:TRZ/ATZ family hydrolase n=1 Tax=Actinocatenispora rupis TaxID=519421 RepID=A0A8J3J404_9ACTN|nr:amidohydrolase family protein [Actinocatenispora rupis]GID09732.1 TRZ/ATZ family hydrolase [Actinocatenispora rupis]
MDVLIRGGRLVDPDTHADVLVRGGRIAAVGPDLAVPPGVEVIDAAGTLVLPGFVDTHRHTWQTALRQTGSDWTLGDYAARMFGPLGAAFRPADVYAGTLLGALAALDAGITTVVDWAHVMATPAHADASVRALRDAGVRAVFAHGWAGGHVGPHPADVRRVRAELLPDDDALVTLALAVRGPDFSDLDTTRADLALARDLGVPVSAHVAGGAPGDHPDGIGALADAKLLGPDLTVVHATGASDTDLALLAEYGVGVSVSPQTELVMPGVGAGTALRRLRRAGVRASLSTDTEVAASADLFSQMRLALASWRRDTPVGEPLPTAADVLRLATADGAAVAGLADRTGAVAVGLAADLVLLRADAVNLAPVTDPAAAVVLGAHPGNVDTVLVAGRVVKRAGRLLADVPAAVAAARDSAARLPL